jgi:hypothetical protein
MNCLKISDCQKTSLSWENVVKKATDFPAKHGVTLTLTCSADYTNIGGNKATCKNGRLVLDNGAPNCIAG